MALPLWNSKTTHATSLCLHPNDGVPLGICGSGHSSNINSFCFGEGVEKGILRRGVALIKSGLSARQRGFRVGGGGGRPLGVFVHGVWYCMRFGNVFPNLVPKLILLFFET